MKKQISNTKTAVVLFFFACIAFSDAGKAQVYVPFSPRTAVASQGTQTY